MLTFCMSEKIFVLIFHDQGPGAKTVGNFHESKEKIRKKRVLT